MIDAGLGARKEARMAARSEGQAARIMVVAIWLGWLLAGAPPQAAGLEPLDPATWNSATRIRVLDEVSGQIQQWWNRVADWTGGGAEGGQQR